MRTYVRDLSGLGSRRFIRACQRRNLRAAEMAALEMRPLSLPDALSLVVLYAAVNSPKFEPAAVRWLSRLADPKRDVTLSQLQFPAAALAELRGRRHEAAVKTQLRTL